jgi:hypothetical protein
MVLAPLKIGNVMDATEVLEHIRLHPEEHWHYDTAALSDCCIVDGAVDLTLVDAHSRLAPIPGSTGCDVLAGACSCGRIHYNLGL